MCFGGHVVFMQHCTTQDAAVLAVHFFSCAADGHALRPALLWMDMRSAKQAAQVLATADIALQVSNRAQPQLKWMHEQRDLWHTMVCGRGTSWSCCAKCNLHCLA